MRQIKYISRQEVQNDHGDLMEAMNTSSGNVVSLKNLAEDELEVLIRQTIGPYALVSLPGRGMDMIVHKDKIREKKVLHASILFKPILEKYHKDHYYWTEDKLYIHYPELVIKNSVGLKHTIYDLIVRVMISPTTGELIKPAFYGARLSYTSREINCKYRHSHLQVGLNREFSAFCRGHGINSFLASLATGMSPFQFDLYLMQLKSFLEWESLEGTPYITISGVVRATSGSREQYRTSTYLMPQTYRDTAVKWLELIDGQRWVRDTAEITRDLGESYAVVPVRHAEETLYVAEKKLSQWFQEQWPGEWDRVAIPWDDTTSRYITNQALPPSQVMSNLFMSEELHIVANKLGLTGRLIQEESETNRITSKRFPTQILSTLIHTMNDLLIQATSDTITVRTTEQS